ncbi:MAG: diguanylate cyclase [Acutalibacteraceae bacterium]
MPGLIYSELNIFCIIISVIILYRIITGINKQFVQQRFVGLIISALEVCVTNTFWGLYQSGYMNPTPAAAKFIDTVYYLSLAAFAYSWFWYSETVQQSELLNQEHRFKRVLPLVILSALILLSNSYGYIFNVDDSSKDRFGPLFWVQVLITYGYIAFTALKAIIISSKKVSYDRRERLYMLGLFAVPTVAAGVVQIFLPQLPLVCAGITVSLLIIYIDVMNRLVLIDPLTQLNNRNQLMRYLSSKMKTADNNTQLYLLIMDVDNFKKINDHFGHVEGDKALMIIARSLQLVCQKHNLFVSRYGGDEFVAVFETADGVHELKHLCNDIDNAIAKNSGDAELAYELSISIGYTKYSKIVRNIPEFIAMADAELYKKKKSKSSTLKPLR